MDLREPLIEATKKLKALRDQLDEQKAREQEPIAIIAAACRLPGGIDSLESYWQLLDEGRDAIEPFPPSRWNTDELYDADADAPGKTYCTQGGFVRDPDFAQLAGARRADILESHKIARHDRRP